MKDRRPLAASPAVPARAPPAGSSALQLRPPTSWLRNSRDGQHRESIPRPSMTTRIAARRAPQRRHPAAGKYASRAQCTDGQAVLEPAELAPVLDPDRGRRAITVAQYSPGAAHAPWVGGEVVGDQARDRPLTRSAVAAMLSAPSRHQTTIEAPPPTAAMPCRQRGQQPGRLVITALAVAAAKSPAPRPLDTSARPP